MIKKYQIHKTKNCNFKIQNSMKKFMKTKFLIFFSLISLTGFSQNLTINNGATLTISKDGKLTVSGSLTNNGDLYIEQAAGESGSLIAKAASTPTIKFKKYLAANQWTLIGIPVTGEVVNDIDDNLATNSGKSAIGYWDNDKSGGAGWVTFNTGSTDANELVPTRGYEIMRSSSGTVLFEGAMINTDQTQAITQGGVTNGNWNLIGNPFPSYLNMTENSDDSTNNFLTVNTAALGNGVYVAVYAWDGTNYDTYNQADGDSQDEMAPGDGFFVYASSNTDVSFTEAMQKHDGGLGFVGSIAPPGDSSVSNQENYNVKREAFFKLKLNDSKESKHLLISFLNNSTLGLDPGYDAGVFKIGNSHIYSKILKDDEGIGLSIQSLPYEKMEDIVVPISIDSKSENISLEVVKNSLPENIHVYLEDKLLGTIEKFGTNNIKIGQFSQLNGYGRFYLHFSTDLIPKFTSDGEFRIFKLDKNQVRLLGNIDKNYKAEIFDYSGRLIKTISFEHKVDVGNLEKGIHILKIYDSNNSVTKKFIVD